ncbi:MAG: hypothetical protein CVV42_11500 [Candidatus Riflebacteria bacterium HGW-Riflebacteria-2]|jgi:hypothetical protein|nr:MAG: hypothetical protein CVV42_11500 [Candidatus Riflebacteria bacterium HGW-Riflebacteria-2]
MSRAAVIVLILLLFVAPGIPGASDSAGLAEIRQYFELRDTISLVNLEMKRALAPDSKSPMLTDHRAESDLAAVLVFLEQRIEQFSSVNTPLKYHYVKKLGGLFNESKQLQASLMVKMRTNTLSAAPGSTIDQPKSPEELAEDLKTHPRPYFQPIDLRSLLSPAVENANKMQFPVATAAVKIQPQKSPFPANMPQKTPVLSDPVPIITPPGEQTASGKTSGPAGIPEKPVPTTEKPTKTLVIPSKSEPVASAAVQLPVPALILPEPVPGSATVTAVVDTPQITPVPATATPVLPTVVETASAPIAPVSFVASEGRVMRPLAVMIENHNKSRPQSGLDQADIVYEMPVEGGITRFMAIYTRLPGLLGPVRSCREYFIDRALEVDALYVHCGSSPGGYAYLSKSKINSVDEIKHSKPFFRDNTRKAPHNLYGRGSSIYDYMSEKISMKLPAAPRLIKYGMYTGEPAEAGESVSIRYHGNYTLDFKFENGVYQRYMNKVLHVDRETQKPLQASAVVVQVAAMKVVDKAGRQEISFIGSGKAWVLEKGKKTAVIWAKKNPRDLTSYKDSDGREYLFPKDLPVWVQVVSPAHKLTFNGVEETAPVAGKEPNEPASATIDMGKQG